MATVTSATVTPTTVLSPTAVDPETVSVCPDPAAPETWNEEYRRRFIMDVHGLDQLPRNHHLLFNPEYRGIVRTCSRCYTVKPKKYFSKKQWRSIDDEPFCVKCIDASYDNKWFEEDYEVQQEENPEVWGLNSMSPHLVSTSP
ncbi:unnamed protein product [Mucor hiemalis]